MSSIVERLTEGVVNRDMRAESHALLSKWKKTGLLEGIETERKQNSMARLLENQAKELLRESTALGGGSVEGFAAVAFPIVRRVFAGLIANDLVSVQPMSLPSGLIFFLDFTFSGDLGNGTPQTDRFGNIPGDSIYGTDRVGSQITGGVNLVGTQGQDLSGPRSSARGYAYASPTASVTTTGATIQDEFDLDGSEAIDQLKAVDFDPDLLALSGSGYKVIVIDAQKSDYDTAQADFDNLSAFEVGGAALNTALSGAAGLETDTTYTLVRRLTRVAGTDVRYIVTAKSSSVGAVTRTGNLVAQVPQRDDINAVGGTAGAVAAGSVGWGLEGNADIPEIDIKVDSIAVTAQTKKLKAKWTPELGQDLNAYHNLDAEVELTSLLSEQIALEIDREILADLVSGATAATRYWSRAPGLFVDANGNEIGASAKAPDFTGTVSEWYETLVETINDVSAQIHRKTLRGGANFVVCGPEVANILEFTAGFRAAVTHDDEKGSIGALRTGSLSKKFDVIVDPYFLRNVILVGRRGASFLESGYVYAPYVPLQTTPTIFGPEDFVPRKGVMTRYAKKMVRPDMYGLVVVRGLLGESGA
jgi:hypothetical protein